MCNRAQRAAGADSKGFEITLIEQGSFFIYNGGNLQQGRFRMLRTWSFWKTFFIFYVALIAGIWGFVEATTFFAGDHLEQLLGSKWWVLYYVLPLFIAFSATALTNKKEETQAESLEQNDQASLASRKKAKGFPWVISLIILLCVAATAGGFGWYYFDGPCGVSKVKEGTTALVDQRNIYGGAYQVAASTSLISLSGPVGELQKIQRDTEKIVVPACMESAKNELILAMDKAADAFRAFMAEKLDKEVSRHVKLSTTHLRKFTAELEAVNKCAPFCQ
jgi:hypothetical protein